MFPRLPARELLPSLPALTAGAIGDVPAQPRFRRPSASRLSGPAPAKARVARAAATESLRKSSARLTSRSDNLPTTDHRDQILGASVTRDNIFYLIIGALVVVIAALSYQLYQDRKQPEGMRIDLGPNGLSIEKK